MYDFLLKVLTDLPQKTEEIIKVPMTAAQEDLYFQLVSDYKERARRVRATWNPHLRRQPPQLFSFLSRSPWG